MKRIIYIILFALSYAATTSISYSDFQRLKSSLVIVSYEALPSGRINVKVKNDGSSQASSAFFDILLYEDDKVADTWTGSSSLDLHPKRITELKLKISKSKAATDAKKNLSDYERFELRWKMAVVFNPETN